jgi:hypothetical protein
MLQGLHIFNLAVGKELNKAWQPVSKCLQWPGHEPGWQDVFGARQDAGVAVNSTAKCFQLIP